MGDARLSRRDLAKVAAKVGVVGAGVVWVAPRFENVAYAASNTGSPIPTTTTSGSTSSTIIDQTLPTCLLTPTTLEGDPPYTLRIRGTNWAPSSKITVTLVGVRVLATITTKPNGSFNVTVQIGGSIEPGSYQIEFRGFDADGDANRCFDSFEIAAPVTTQSTTGATTAPTSGGGGSVDDNSALPFTGTDSRALLLVGTGALVIGRSLYALRNRLGDSGDAADARIR